MNDAVKVYSAPVVLSTASVYPERAAEAFEVAARLGYDGVEVMVSGDPVSQDVDVLERLTDYHHVPVLAIHAPCLLITQRVWGREPWAKLRKAKDVAERLGAKVVVVHPPFRWQRDYVRDFEDGLARMHDETDVVFAVENMYPLRARGTEVVPYAPHWNPVDQGYQHVTLDLSHTAVSGSDALEMAQKLGGRLAHVHMADGAGGTNRDEHLVPGRGSQRCAELLEHLAATGYPGLVVLEVNTRRAMSRDERRADLAEALAFTRLNLYARKTTDASRPASGAAKTPGATAGGANAGRTEATGASTAGSNGQGANGSRFPGSAPPAASSRA